MAGIGEDRGSPRHPCLAYQRRKAMVARDDVLARHRLAGWSQSICAAIMRTGRAEDGMASRLTCQRWTFR